MRLSPGRWLSVLALAALLGGVPAVRAADSGPVLREKLRELDTLVDDLKQLNDQPGAPAATPAEPTGPVGRRRARERAAEAEAVQPAAPAPAPSVPAPELPRPGNAPDARELRELREDASHHAEDERPHPVSDEPPDLPLRPAEACAPMDELDCDGPPIEVWRIDHDQRELLDLMNRTRHKGKHARLREELAGLEDARWHQRAHVINEDHEEGHTGEHGATEHPDCLD